MANFSAKERIIASLLSATPGLKRVVKNTYILVNSLIYRKGYAIKVLDHRISEPFLPFGDSGSYGGYYDKTSVNSDGCYVGLRYKTDTSKKPTADKSVDILVTDADGGVTKIGETYAYNWQQGARVHWIDNTRIIFNVFDGQGYRAVVKNIDDGSEKVYEYPVQDSYDHDYFLSINYRRIMAMRPDYGYRNLPEMTKTELAETADDGIWKVSYRDSSASLILSLADVISFDTKPVFKDCLHNVNHLMIKPDGTGFIFIHRWYSGKRRYDRLMYYNFENLRVLADEGMVSHMCWIDDNTLFGYLRHEGKNGFYFIDLGSGKITPCDRLTDMGNGDGHPSCHGDWITFDTYPDKSRMQRLYLYNFRTDELFPLLELHHPVKYMEESRCDLHPRFSADGRYICFDSVFKGNRNLCYVNVSGIVNPVNIENE